MDAIETKLRTLSPDRCWELLAQCETARLAVTVAGHPDIFPVNYRILDQSIVVRTGDGRLLASALDSPAIALEVDALDHGARTGWSIVVKGTAEEPAHMEDYLSAEQLDITPWAGGAKDRYLLISPTEVTGRVIPPTSCRVTLADIHQRG